MSEETPEEKRRQMAEEMAQVNVLRTAEVIGEGGNMLLVEARRRNALGERTTSAHVVITNALALGMAVLTNERARAMAFSRKSRSGPLPTRVELVRIPLPEKSPPQVSAGSPGAAPANEPIGGRSVQASSAVVPVDQPAASSRDLVHHEPDSAPRRDPGVDDSPAIEGELLTDDDTPTDEELDALPVIEFASQAIEECLTPVQRALLKALSTKGKR